MAFGFGSRITAPTLLSAGGGGGGSLAALFGAGDNGYIFDGSLSRFYVDSGMTTLCADSGVDPVGAVEDVSGKGNHLLQTTTANKPIYRSAAGVQRAEAGYQSGTRRWLVCDNASFVGAEWIRWTRYIAYVRYEGFGALAGFIKNNNAINGLYIVNTSQMQSIIGSSGGTTLSAIDSNLEAVSAMKHIVELYPSSPTSFHLSKAVNVPSADLGNTGSGATNASYPAYDPTAGSLSYMNGDIAYETLGAYYFTGSIREQIAFSFLINRVLTDEEQATVEAYIKSKFTGITR